MTYTPVVLDAFGVKSYEELGQLGSEEVIRRLDAQEVPLHPGDKALGVLVLAALVDLRESTERLDRAGRRFEVATIVLAALGVLLTAAGVVVAIVAL